MQLQEQRNSQFWSLLTAPSDFHASFGRFSGTSYGETVIPIPPVREEPGGVKKKKKEYRISDQEGRVPSVNKIFTLRL